MSPIRSFLMFMRAAAGVQVVLGIGFWLGYWAGLVNLHMAIGSLYVLALFIIAGIALGKRRATGLAAFAILWGLIVAWMGMAQRTMLVGDMHWIVRVAHLIIGLAAMPIAERLVRETTPSA